MIDLKHKTSKEKAQIKSKELAKVKLSKFKKDNFDIEIIGDIKEIEVNGSYGIELFATAFKNGKQLGFGKDGSVEIERFRFFNPPVLVDDPNGDIIREWTDDITGEIKQRKLREDTDEVIKQILEQTIKLVGKDGKDIIKGKIGNTTSTFYPAGSADDDNSIYNPTFDTWANIRSATSGTLRGGATNYIQAWRKTDPSNDSTIERYFATFDTSALPDTDTISSAVLSLYITDVVDPATNTNWNVKVYNSTHSSPIVAGDFDLRGSTEYSNGIKLSGFTKTAYNDFTFNTAGKDGISKTSVSKFSIYEAYYDAGAIDPTELSQTYIAFKPSSTAGTTEDPKLVVEHSAPSANPAFLLNLLGVG